MEPQRPTLADLTHVGKMITIQIQSGGHGITFADIYRGLERGDLWTFLESKMPGFDWMRLILDTPSPRPTLLIASLKEAADMYRHQEHQDLGVKDDHGLALLLALVLVAIDDKLWMEPLPSTHEGHGFPPAN